jgi:Cysteine rich repeat
MIEMKPLTRATARRLVTLVCVCIGSIGLALAQQPNQAQINTIRQACRADYQTHCASVPTGGPEALTCLKENAASLSAPCQRAVAAVSGSTPSVQGRRPAAATAAPSPAAPVTVAPAPAAPTPAVPAYQTSPPPMSPRQEAFLLRRACGQDFRAYCGDVPPGGGRIIACLEANGPSLSRQCRSALISARQGR